LVDNLATEPIVDIDEELYCIKVVAYHLAGVGENIPYAQRIDSGVSGAISKEEAKA